jgi:hypothetical protein
MYLNDKKNTSIYTVKLQKYKLYVISTVSTCWYA